MTTPQARGGRDVWIVDALAVIGGVVLATSVATDPVLSGTIAVGGGLIGLIVARRAPAVAVLAPAVALVAAMNGVDLDRPLGAMLLGGAVAAALRSPGLDVLLAPVLPLGVVGLSLVLDLPILPVAVVLATVVGLALAAVSGPRPRGEPVAGVLRERAAFLPLLALLVPVVLLAAVMIPRIERNNPAARPGEPDSTAGNTIDAPYPGFGGDLDVGEPVELGREVVMRVEADDATFWRVDTYADFDGRSWSGRAGTEDDLLVPTGQAAERFRQVFTMARPLAGAVPTAYRPLGVATADGIGRLRGDATILPGPPLRTDERYVVTSVRQPVSEASLRRSRPVAEIGLSDELALLTRVEVTDRVDRLAHDITAGLDSDFDRIRAIEAYFEDEITYTRDIEPLPAGADAVDHLLFESRRGFCEQIGTALVVMARALGIPARLTVGYVPVERDALRGEWVVREDHAHAWAEVWFPDGGWQGFDPTAGVPLAADSGTDDGVGDVVRWIMGGLAVALAAAAARWAWSRSRRRTEPTDTWRRDAVTRLDALAERVGADDRSTLLRTGSSIDERLPVSETVASSARTAARLLDRDVFGSARLAADERREVDEILATLEQVTAAGTAGSSAGHSA